MIKNTVKKIISDVVTLTPSPLNTDVVLVLDLMCNQENLYINKYEENNSLFLELFLLGIIIFFSNLELFQTLFPRL